MPKQRLNNLREQILDRGNLRAAWEQVLAKKGGPGVDGVTLQRWARNWEANLERLREQTQAGTYRPNRPKRFMMRKKSGGLREISRLTVSDKVLQRAVLNVIEDDFDQRFLPCSHGYRDKRSVATAVQRVLQHRDLGLRWVFDADISDCFNQIRHDILMRRIQAVVADPFVLRLTELWLQVYRREKSQPVGIPLGAVLSPLWCNIYLHLLDARLTCANWALTRYADDFVVLAWHEREAQEAQYVTEGILDELGLALNTRKTHVSCFEEGFEFLGVWFYRDTYAYQYLEKRIEVDGRSVKWLYRSPPLGYS